MLNAPFEDGQIRRITGYQNNCGLNVIAHQFARDLANGLHDHYLMQVPYTEILEHFKAYHFRPELTWADLKAVLAQNLDKPITLEVLLGPVLRKSLGDILKANSDYRETKANDFKVFIRAALSAPHELDHTFYPINEACFPKTASLSKEFNAFLTRPEIDRLDAERALDQFMDEKNDEINNYWDTVGYNATIDFICDPYNEIPLDPADIQQIGTALSYKIELYRGSNKEKWDIGEAMDDEALQLLTVAPLATIKMYNRADVHYESIADTAEAAAAHNAQFEQEANAYGLAHQIQTEYKAQSAQLNNKSLSDWQQKTDLHGELFNRANAIMDHALNIGVPEKQFTLLWDSLERCVKEGNKEALDNIEQTIKPRSRL